MPNPIEPVDSVVQLVYQCTACGEIGNDVTLSQVMQPTEPKHTCPHCNHVDDVRRVFSIGLAFHKNTQTNEEFEQMLADEIEKAQMILVSHNMMNEDEARLALKRAKAECPNSFAELVQLAIHNHEQQSEPAKTVETSTLTWGEGSS